MDRKKIFFYISFIILALVLFPLIQNIIEGERGRIKRLIFSARRAVEQEDLLRLSGYISFEYQDKYGNDRRNLLFIGQTVFREYEDFSLQINDLNLKLDLPDASAEMEILGLARRSTQTQKDSPLEYDRVKLKVGFRKEENGWKIRELEFLETEEFSPVLDFMTLSNIISYNESSEKVPKYTELLIRPFV